MYYEDLENQLKKSAPTMDTTTSKKLSQKVLKLYAKQFKTQNTSKTFSKRLKLFTNLSLIKKPFLITLTTTTLFAFFALTTFLSPRLQENTQGLTLETLVAKAQAAAEKKANEGKYYYQKTVEEGPNTTKNTLELWKDTLTGDYIKISTDIDEKRIHYGKITDAEINKGNSIFRYNGAMQQLYENPFNENDLAFFDFTDLSKKLGTTLEAVIDKKTDKKNLEPFIKNLFPNYRSFGDHYEIEIKYLGQMQSEGKNFEILSFEQIYPLQEGESGKRSRYSRRFYFNAENFDLEMIRFFSNNEFSNWEDEFRAEIKILIREYTDVIPTVTIDPIDKITFSLGNNSLLEQKGKKIYQDSKIKFFYPNNYFINKEFSPGADALNDTQQERVFDTKRVKYFSLSVGGGLKYSNTDETVFIFITPDKPEASFLLSEAQRVIQFPFGLQDNCSELEFIFSSKNDLDKAPVEKEMQTMISRGQGWLNYIDEKLRQPKQEHMSESDYENNKKRLKEGRKNVEKICGKPVEATINKRNPKLMNGKIIEQFSIKSKNPDRGYSYAYGYYFIENGMYYQFISTSAMNEALEQVIESFTIQ